MEQQGEAFLALVERVRRATIEQRRTGSEAARRAVARELDAIDLPSAEALIRAFSLYFLLTNLAEEKERVRRLRRRGRTATPAATDGTISAAVRALRRTGACRRRVRGRSWSALDRPGAHGASHGGAPADHARRAAPLLPAAGAARRPAPDARPRTRRSAAACARRSPSCGTRRALRVEAPSPLDEVRSVMAFFDESLFVIAPRLCREMDLALDAEDRRLGGATADDEMRRPATAAGPGRGHRGPARSCAGARGWAATATATPT